MRPTIGLVSFSIIPTPARLAGLAVLLLLAAFLAIDGLREEAHAATFTVNSTGDEPDDIPGDGICHTALNTCTLRAAIQTANGLAGADSIQFSIAGVISPASPLPVIFQPLSIDATAGAGPSTCAPLAPGIVLNGAGAGAGANGLAFTSGSNLVRGLAVINFSGNGTTTGIGIDLSVGSGSSISCNLIGIAADGITAAGNAAGVYIHASSISNTIGGPLPSERNIISGNSVYGVRLVATAAANLIQGNYIGTNRAGDGPVGNGQTGVTFEGPAAVGTIRGNVISGNTVRAIQVGSTAAGGGVIIAGNRIGTSADGLSAVPNGTPGGQYAVLITNAPRTVIGGTSGLTPGACTGDCNLISGNNVGGILVNGEGTGVLIQNNFIGTDILGTGVPAGHVPVGVGNTTDGIGMNVAEAAIVEGNLLSGNGDDGVSSSFAGATALIIRGNKIGTNAAGTSGISNRRGVRIHNSTGVTIGGATPAEANLIAFNVVNGVLVNAAGGARINGNSIHSNGVLGIDLGTAAASAIDPGDGVTPNDVGDADTGPSGLQNFPVLNASPVAGLIPVGMSLNSTSSTSFQVEVFSSAACTLPSNFGGQGKTLLGSATVSTDSTGNVTFTVPVGIPALVGDRLTATATRVSTGATSEFSACATVISAPVGAQTYTVVNTNDAGPGSLRQSILDANAHVGADTIAFNISGGGVHTITPASALPAISDAVRIDGSTQPLASCGPTRTLLIVVDIGSVPAGATGTFDVYSDNSTVRGLVLINNELGTGVVLRGNNNTATCNNIGVGADGLAVRVDLNGLPRGGNSNGVVMYGNGNTVGGPNASDRNVIGASINHGVAVVGASGNAIRGNYIGLGADGTTQVPNRNGVYLYPNSSANVVGGVTTPGACDQDCNLVTGNATYGIWIDRSSGNTVSGNYVGLDSAGNIPFPAPPPGFAGDDGRTDAAIAITKGSNNIIGGTTADRRNVVGGVDNGIGILGSAEAPFSDCGSPGNPNTSDEDGDGFVNDGCASVGVASETGAQCTNSLDDDGDGFVNDGCPPVGPGASGNQVIGNFVGVSPDGMFPRLLVGSTYPALTLSVGATDNVIGGPSLAATCAGACNLIGGSYTGIVIQDAFTDGNRVQGNWFGLTVDGAGAIGNTNGIVVTATGIGGDRPGPANTLIGGPNPGEGNRISNGTSNGVYLSNTANATLERNLISGHSYGLVIHGPFNVRTLVGDTLPGRGNVISGNGTGVNVNGGATNTTIQGNKIGTNGAGTSAVANGSDGIRLSEPTANTQIGGFGSAARNVISGNSGSGVVVNGATNTGVSIQGNYIGLGADGTTIIANTATGVSIFDSPNAVIGGPASGWGNVISGNGARGIDVSGATGTSIQFNLIATDATGLLTRANLGDGIALGAGAASGSILDNVIAGNGGHGIAFVNAGGEHLVRSNRIGVGARMPQSAASSKLRRRSKPRWTSLLFAVGSSTPARG